MKYTGKLQKLNKYLKNGTILAIIISKIRCKLKSIIKNCIGFEWQHYYVLSLNCNTLSDTFNELPDDNIQIANDKDWDDAELVQELGIKKINHIKERCRKQDYSCIIYKNKSVQCFGFISYNEMELKNDIKFYLPDNVAFLYDDYCCILYRRQGLYKKILKERCRIIKQKGYEKIITIVSPANRPSWQGHKTWDKEVGFYWYRIHGKEYCTLKQYNRISKTN